MRMLRHLVAFDVRRHKWLLTMWVGVLIASALFDGVRPELALKPGIHATAGLLDALIWWSWLVIAVAIVPLVIQSHPLVGSDAFWMTRPIAPGELFASKALLVGTVTLVLPAIADLTVMVSHQVPIRDACGVLADSTLWRAICVMTLAVAAAATGSMARFTLMCGVAIIAVVAMAAGVTAYLFSMDRNPGQGTPFQPADPTSWVVLIAMSTCAEAVWLLIQYRTRSRVRAAGAGVIGVATAFVVSACWPWPILAVNPDFPRTDGQSALRLVTSSGATEVKDWRAPFGSRSKWQVLRSRVGVAAIEPGWTASGSALEGALQIDGRTALQSLGPTAPSPLPLDGDGPDPTSGVLRRLLGVDWLPETPMPEWPMAHLMVFRQDALPVRAVGRATYRGRMQVVLTKHVVEAALPLQPGMSHVNGPLRIAIESVDASRGDAIVTIRSSNATSSFTRKPGSTFSYYLRNLHTRQAIGATEVIPAETFDFSRFPVPQMFFGVAVGTGPTSGFEARIWRIGFESRDRAVPWHEDDRWLKDAELVVVRDAQQMAVERSITVPDFAIREVTTYGPGSPAVSGQ